MGGDFIMALDMKEERRNNDIIIKNDAEALTKLSRCNVCTKWPSTGTMKHVQLSPFPVVTRYELYTV